MPDVTDLARLDEEMAPLRARLDDLAREYNRVCDEINEHTLAGLDVTDLTARVRAATGQLPAILAAAEPVLAVYGEARDLAMATFPDTGVDPDDPWSRLLEMCGASDLDDALGVLVARLTVAHDRGEVGGEADAARVKLDEIVGRAR